MINDEKNLLLHINDLIIEKLEKFPSNVRELAIEAIRLSDISLFSSEIAVAEQLQAFVRKLIRKKEGELQ